MALSHNRPTPVAHLSAGHGCNIPASCFSKFSITFTSTSPQCLVLLIGIVRPRTLETIMKSDCRLGISSSVKTRLMRRLHDLDQLASTYTFQMAPAPCPSAPPPTEVTICTLNVRVSIVGKVGALTNLLHNQQYPDIVCLQEVGPRAPQFLALPQYHCYTPPTSRASLGCAILLRRHLNITLVHTDHDDRGRAACSIFSITTISLIVFCIYMPATPDIQTFQDILHWCSAKMLSYPDAIPICAGDWNVNPAWSTGFPTASGSITDLAQSFLRDHDLCRVRCDPELPTWVSPRGLLACIDHILVPENLVSCPATVVLGDPFPTDHFPVLASLPIQRPSDPILSDPPIQRFATDRLHDATIVATYTAMTEDILGDFDSLSSTTSQLCAALTDGIRQAASQVLGTRRTRAFIPAFIHRLAVDVQRQTASNPLWWAHPASLLRVADARQRLHLAWDLHTTEQHLGIQRSSTTSPSTGPTKAIYKRIMGSSSYSAFEPSYSSTTQHPIALHPHIIAEQLRSRHLRPLSHLSADDILTITTWQTHPMPYPEDIDDTLQYLLAHTPNTTPYHDQVSYPLLRALGSQGRKLLSTLAHAICAGDVPPSILVADFYTLPKKSPHTYVANTRPITNMATLWKLMAMLLKTYIQDHLIQNDVIPPTQLAIYPSSSPADAIRLLHDHIHFYWHTDRPVWFIADDVTHAFGSPDKDLLLATAQAANVHPSLLKAIHSVLHGTKIFTPRQGTTTHVHVSLEAGAGQGDPLSALLYCLFDEVRVALVRNAVGAADSLTGPTTAVKFMDDSTWCASDAPHLLKTATAMAKAGHKTHLLSDEIKTLLVGAKRHGWIVTMLDIEAQLHGQPLRCAKQNEYVRILGRHALPHIFHKTDTYRLYAACRKGSLVISRADFPCHIPVLMYDAKTGGTLRWYGMVRPPRHRVLRLANSAAASAIRRHGNMELIDSALFLAPVSEGGTGLLPAMEYTLSSFIQSLTKQLNHVNPKVRASTRLSLLHFAWRTHPDLPCAALQDCDVHRDDYSRFLGILHTLGWHISFPTQSTPLPTTPYPMAQEDNALNRTLLHDALAAGLHTVKSGIQQGFPFPPHIHSFDSESAALSLPPYITTAIPISASIPQCTWTGPVLVIHDASFSEGKAGGAIVLIELNPLHTHTIPVPIPLWLDSSFLAETYTAWVMLRILHKHASHTPLGVCASPGLQDVSSFMDCKSYIQALSAHRPKMATDLHTCLLNSAVQLSKDLSLPIPTHLYSHISGSFLDTALDLADRTAKMTAQAAQPQLGWLEDLQPPMVCFTKQGRQYHNPVSQLLKDLHLYIHQPTSIHRPKPVDLQIYTETYDKGELPWSFHLHITSIRLKAWHFPPTDKCHMCAASLTPSHYWEECPLRTWYFCTHHYQLASRLPGLYAPWREVTPLQQGVLIRYEGSHFLLTVSPTPEDPVDIDLFPNHILVPQISISHLGLISPASNAKLHQLSAPRKTIRMLLRAVIMHTVWFHRRR